MTPAGDNPEGPLFPRLRSGPRRIPAERVAAHQKARLQGAMVEAVARRGYSGTSVRDLVALAGVSKGAFYEYFENKQDCFLATLDTILAAASHRVGLAYSEPGDFREKMTSALKAFMDLVVEEPAAASLAAVESLTLGAAGVAHRERASEVFERIVAESFRRWPGEREVSDPEIRAIVNGIAGIVYRRLRSGDQTELPGLVDQLVDWGFSYRRTDGEAVATAIAAAEQARPVDVEEDEEGDKPGWKEPPSSRLSKTTLSQRERIVRGAAQVVVARGYNALSIPAISAAAGTSNQTFYEHFHSKHDAFLAAFEEIAMKVLGHALIAFKSAGDGPEAIGAGLRDLTEQIAAHEMFARLAFFELPAAGPQALDRADATLDSVTAFLEPPLAPAGIGGPVPRAIREVISTGVWAVIQREIANDRGAALPQLAPELTRIALAPLQAAAQSPP